MLIIRASTNAMNMNEHVHLLSSQRYNEQHLTPY